MSAQHQHHNKQALHRAPSSGSRAAYQQSTLSKQLDVRGAGGAAMTNPGRANETPAMSDAAVAAAAQQQHKIRRVPLTKREQERKRARNREYQRRLEAEATANAASAIRNGVTLPGGTPQRAGRAKVHVSMSPMDISRATASGPHGLLDRPSEEFLNVFMRSPGPTPDRQKLASTVWY